jgi:hypothetical protein
MYKALNLETLEEIVILQRRWKENLDILRKLDHKDRIGCPGCRQPVRVRAGAFRRWHFAHKHLENCPYARLSPGLLESRAVLYDWLSEQYGESAVSVEREVPGLPRPVDIWVIHEGIEIAYWIHSLRLSPDIRHSLAEKLESTGRIVHYPFVLSMLKEDPQQTYWVHLTTTERQFMRQSILDTTAEAAGEAAGKTLHYLDSARKVLVTYRRLRLQHPPQRYSGKKTESELRFASILLQSGEFLHPHEQSLLRKQHSRAEAARARLIKREDFFHSTKSLNDQSYLQDGTEPGLKTQFTNQDQHLPVFSQPFRRAGNCIHCGKETEDWISFNGKTGECVCRECHHNRK